MTRDEILNMPAGREMDALVATEVMGLEKVHKYCGEWIYDMDMPLPFCGAPIVKHYSSSILNAWEVVEKFIERYSTPGPMGGERRCMFGMYFNRTQAFGFDSKHYQVFIRKTKGKGITVIAPTLPLAICRAALLATLEAE